MLGVPMGARMAPELHPDVWRGVSKKFHMTNFTILYNFSFMKYAKNQFLALLMLGSPMGMGMAP